MKTVILDTNFLFIPFQFNVDIFDEIQRVMQDAYKIFILEKTLEELDFLIEKERGKIKDYAKLSKALVTRNKIEILDLTKQKDLYITPISKGVDDLLVELSSKDIIIATLDKEIKTNIQKKGNQIIYLRNKNHLEMV